MIELTDPAVMLLESLRSIRERLYVAGSIQGTDGRRFDLWPAGMTAHAGAALRDLIIAEQPRAVTAIETGLAFGLATSFILEGMLQNRQRMLAENRHPASVHVTSIDPFQTRDWADAGVRHLADAGVGALHTIIQTRSAIALPALAAQGLRYDLAFIDGDHRFEHAFLDIFHARSLLHPHGLVIIDDAWMPSIRKAAAFFTRNELCTPDPTPHGPDHPTSPLKRFLLLRPNARGDHRAWDHFQDF